MVLFIKRLNSITLNRLALLMLFLGFNLHSQHSKKLSNNFQNCNPKISAATIINEHKDKSLSENFSQYLLMMNQLLNFYREKHSSDNAIAFKGLQQNFLKYYDEVKGSFWGVGSSNFHASDLKLFLEDLAILTTRSHKKPFSSKFFKLPEKFLHNYFEHLKCMNFSKMSTSEKEKNLKFIDTLVKSLVAELEYYSPKLDAQIMLQSILDSLKEFPQIDEFARDYIKKSFAQSITKLDLKNDPNKQLGRNHDLNAFLDYFAKKKFTENKHNANNVLNYLKSLVVVPEKLQVPASNLSSANNLYCAAGKLLDFISNPNITDNQLGYRVDNLFNLLDDNPEKLLNFLQAVKAESELPVKFKEHHVNNYLKEPKFKFYKLSQAMYSKFNKEYKGQKGPVFDEIKKIISQGLSESNNYR